MKSSLQALAALMVSGTLLSATGCGQEATAPAESTDAASTQPAQEINGEEIYQNFCFSCHTPGLSGAPKLGDVDAWAPRIAKGKELLLQATIEGVPPAMPPRGICMSCSDAELAAAIEYMINESQ